MNFFQLANEEKLQNLFKGMRFIGKKIYFYEEIDSTNLEAKRLICSDREKELNGALIIALKQTGGIGTKGRSWFSPKGMGLYTSVIFYPPKDFTIKNLQELTGKIGREIENEVRTLCDKTNLVRLKKPNDILINNKKVIGVLCESSTCRETINHIIIGLGINLLEPRVEIPLNLKEKIGFLSNYLAFDELLFESYKKIVLSVDRIISFCRKSHKTNWLD